MHGSALCPGAHYTRELVQGSSSPRVTDRGSSAATNGQTRVLRDWGPCILGRPCWKSSPSLRMAEWALENQLPFSSTLCPGLRILIQSGLCPGAVWLMALLSLCVASPASTVYTYSSANTLWDIRAWGEPTPCGTSGPGDNRQPASAIAPSTPPQDRTGRAVFLLEV